MQSLQANTEKLSMDRGVSSSVHTANFDNNNLKRLHQPQVIASTTDLSIFICQSVALLWKKTVNNQLIPFVKYMLTSLSVNIESVALLSVIYIFKLRQKTPNHSLKQNYESRIIIAGLILSQKYLEDSRWTNQTWSVVTGLKREEINQMEKDFLSHLNWSLFISFQEFQCIIKSIRRTLLTLNSTPPNIHTQTLNNNWLTPPSSPNQHYDFPQTPAIQYMSHPSQVGCLQSNSYQADQYVQSYQQGTTMKPQFHQKTNLVVPPPPVAAQHRYYTRSSCLNDYTNEAARMAQGLTGYKYYCDQGSSSSLPTYLPPIGRFS